MTQDGKEVLLTLNNASLEVGFVSSFGDAIHGANGLEHCL
jgi:hypothetical protein